jgi:hypothetical protein
MKFLVLVFILLAAGFVNAQGKAERGKIDEIKGMSKVYVSAAAADREAIIKQIDGKAGLKVVADANEAEFFLTFKVLRRDENLYTTLVIGELDVHLREGEKVRSVWSKEGSGGAYGNATATGLAKKFLKDYEKLSKAGE